MTRDVRIGLHEFLHCLFRHVRVLEDKHGTAHVGEWAYGEGGASHVRVSWL